MRLSNLFESIPKKIKLWLLSFVIIWIAFSQYSKLNLQARYESDLAHYDQIIQKRKAKVSQSLEALNISDRNLKECIQSAAIELASIHPNNTGGIDNVAELKNLYCPGRNIRSLTGIQGLEELRFLDINRNYVKDASPLAANLQLRHLYLRGNPLKDIRFLTSLSKLERVILPSLPKIRCNEITQILGSTKSNVNIIECDGKSNSIFANKKKPMQEKKEDPDRLSHKEEQEMMNYRYNLKRLNQ